MLQRVQVDGHASLALDEDTAWQHIAQGASVPGLQLHQHAVWLPEKLIKGLATPQGDAQHGLWILSQSMS